MARAYKHWDFNSTIEAASNYRSRSEFQKGCRGAYEAARRAGMLDALFPIIRTWDVSQVKPVAIKHILVAPKIKPDDVQYIREQVEYYIDTPFELVRLRNWCLKEHGQQGLEICDEMIKKLNGGSSNNP